MPKAQNSPIRMYFLIQATENNGSTLAESECRVCGLRMKVSSSVINSHVFSLFNMGNSILGESRFEHGKTHSPITSRNI